MWWYVAGFYLALAAVTAASFRWGDRLERQVAGLFVVAAIASIAARWIETRTYFFIVDHELGVAVVDLLLLAGLTVLSVRTGRWWVICEAALQVTTMTGHLAKAMTVPLSDLAYALMAGASSYPALLLLAIGILQTRLLRRPTAPSSARSSIGDRPHDPRRPRGT